METYSVLILDDEIENINLLEIYIKKFCKSVGRVFSATTIDDATNLYLEHAPDILLLDIELGNNQTSFSLLENIPSKKSEIVFVTSHQDYAIQAINKTHVNAYLVKPVSPSNLVMAIEKCINNINNKGLKATTDTVSDTSEYSDFLAIPSNNKIDIIHPEEIVYLEAEGRYTVFHLTSGSTKVASRNLGEYEKQLNPKNFFRIHHSFLVNLEMVININKSAGNYCELLNGKALPIAKRRQEELHKFLKIK